MNNQLKTEHHRKWFVMAAVTMGILLATIDSSIVNIALPTLVRELNTNFSTIQWVVLVYLLTLVTLLLSIGRLADMIGKKPIYLTGFIIFTIGSMLCGLSSSVYFLIFFRIIQAIGATMILGLGAAIVTEAFPAQERGKALGISGSMVSLGIILGPTLGGMIVDFLSWHWIFFVNIPVGIIGSFMVFRFILNTRPVEKQHFDIAGAITLFLALSSFLFSITLGQGSGFNELRILLLFFLSIIFLTLFIIIELRTDQPMIDLRLFKKKLFTISLFTGFLTFFSIGSTLILMPFYLENVLKYEPHQVGFLLAALPIVMGITSPIAGTLSDRFGTRPITLIGLTTLVLGFFGLSKLNTTTSTVEFILLYIPIGLGMGIFQSPNNSTIMGSAPSHRLGIVSGMLAVTRSLGQTTGIAVLGAVWAGQVMSYSITKLEGGATSALPIYQVMSLQIIFSIIVIVILFALGLSLLGYFLDRKEKIELAREMSFD